MNIDDHNKGLLTDSERKIITGEKTGSEDQRSEIIEELGDRVPETLNDMRLLYHYLEDEELTELFTTADGKTGETKAFAQYTCALLYYVVDLIGGDVEHRLSSAIKQAEAAREQHAAVDISITTEPFLPPEQRKQAIQRENDDRVSMEAVEHLYFDNTLSAEDLADALTCAGMEDISAEEVREQREANPDLVRHPVPVITGVEVEREEIDSE